MCYLFFIICNFILQADNQRKEILEKISSKGFKASAKALEVDSSDEPDTEELLRKYKAAHHNRDDFQLKVLDSEMKSVTDELSNAIKEYLLHCQIIYFYVHAIHSISKRLYEFIFVYL